MRSSSRPAVGEGAQPPRGHVGPHRVVERVAQERGDVELRLAEHGFRVDREMAIAGPEDVVVVEVAVDEHVAADVEQGVELARERDQVAALLIRALRLVEPARDVVPDPAERLRRPAATAGSRRRRRSPLPRPRAARRCPCPDVRAPAGVRAGRGRGVAAERRRRRPRARARPAPRRPRRRRPASP